MYRAPTSRDAANIARDLDKTPGELNEWIAWNNGINRNVFGATVLKKYYVYHDNRDHDTLKVGVGLKNPAFVMPPQHTQSSGK